MTKETGTMSVLINQFGPIYTRKDADDIIANKPDQRIQHIRGLLQFFFGENFPLSADLVEQYFKVASEDFYIPIVPHSEELFLNLVKPLQSAKRCFCFKEYLATISLCGVTSEMLSIFISFCKAGQMESLTKGNSLTAKKSYRIFNGAMHLFERIRIFGRYRLINTNEEKLFGKISGIRKKHLHYWDKMSRANEESDALTILRYSFELVKIVFGVGIKDGKVTIKQEVIDYLNKDD